jgi:hypothetical protein
MSVLYRQFAEPWEHVLLFDDDSMLSLYNHESYGTPLSQKNGFAQGKKMLNLQVSAWKEMLREGTLAKFELYEDSRYPEWWLDSVLQNTYTGLTYEDLLKTSRSSSGLDSEHR